MDLHQLRIFQVLAKVGSFTRAAEELHTVQSNVTSHIKQLEGELGRELLVRRRNGVLLTAEGKVLLDYANRILGLADEVRRSLGSQAAPTGPLHIGALESTSAIHLPALLSEFNRRFPDVAISLLSGTSGELLKAVASYELDGAFIASVRGHPELAQRRVLREELVLITGREVTSARALLAATPPKPMLVFPAGCLYRTVFEQWLTKSGYYMPRKVMEFRSIDALLGCAAAGMGIALAPRSIAECHARRDDLSVHRFPARLGRIDTVFVWRKDTEQSAPLRAFLDLATEFFHGRELESRAEKRAPKRAVSAIRRNTRSI